MAWVRIELMARTAVPVVKYATVAPTTARWLHVQGDRPPKEPIIPMAKKQSTPALTATDRGLMIDGE